MKTNCLEVCETLTKEKGKYYLPLFDRRKAVSKSKANDVVNELKLKEFKDKDFSVSYFDASGKEEKLKDRKVVP